MHGEALKDLWQAVLKRAILDACGRVRPAHVYARSIWTVRRDARAWILCRDEAPCTYHWVCGVLGLDPDTIRDALDLTSGEHPGADVDLIPVKYQGLTPKPRENMDGRC